MIGLFCRLRDIEFSFLTVIVFWGGTYFGVFATLSATVRFFFCFTDDAINDVIEFPRTVGDFGIRDVRGGNSP